MRTEIKVITPNEANEILSNNPKNRKLRKIVVDRYARDMAEGRWENDSPNPIVFGKDGSLKDGQHRLNALIKANVPVQFLVVTVSDDVSHIDTGLGRNTSDIYRMRAGNEVNNTIWGAIVLKLSGAQAHKHPSKTEQIEEYEKNSEKWETAYRISAKGNSNAILRNSCFVVAFYNALACGVSEEILENFARVANSGMQEGKYQNSAILMRNEIFVNKTFLIRGHSDRWRTVGFAEEYIRLFANKSERTRRIVEPTWCYTKANQMMEE